MTDHLADRSVDRVGIDFLDLSERMAMSLPIALIATDLAGIVTHWSDQATTLYGWAREEALGSNIRDLTVGPDNAAIAEDIMARLGGGVHWEGEFRARDKHGREIDVHVLDVPVVDRSGVMVGICGLSVDVSAQRGQWRQVHEQTENLLLAMETAREDEQRRIANDIHDDIGQYLTALRTDLAGLLEADVPPGESVEVVRRSIERVDEVLAEVRRICAELDPPVLTQLGLGSAVAHLANQIRHRSGRRVVVDGDPDIPRLAASAELAVFRIVEEALTNIERHAQADTVTVSLRLDPPGRAARWLLVEVADDGIGIGRADDSPTSMGLSVMRRRAERVGATLSVGPRDDHGCGTRVTLSVPIAPPS
jgi:PAS domain S-box-containing protein